MKPKGSQGALDEACGGPGGVVDPRGTVDQVVGSGPAPPGELINRRAGGCLEGRLEGPLEGRLEERLEEPLRKPLEPPLEEPLVSPGRASGGASGKLLESVWRASGRASDRNRWVACGGPWS